MMTCTVIRLIPAGGPILSTTTTAKKGIFASVEIFAGDPVDFVFYMDRVFDDSGALSLGLSLAVLIAGPLGDLEADSLEAALAHVVAESGVHLLVIHGFLPFLHWSAGSEI